MPLNDVYQISIDTTYNNQNCVNVLHYVQITGDGTGDGRQAVADMWDADNQTLFRGLMTVGALVVQTRTRRLAAIESQTLIQAVGSAGTHSGGGMPSGAAALIRQKGLSTDARKGTGGQKIVAVPYSVVDSGRLTEAYMVLMRAYGALGESDQQDPFATWDFRQCILGSDDFPRIIQHTSAAPRIVTVRSRQIGVGT